MTDARSCSTDIPAGVLLGAVPQLDEAEAARLAQDHFGVTGVVGRLPSERDGNFHIACQDGRAFVLKVGNAAEDPALTGMQTAALRHIQARAPAVQVPEVCPTLAGAEAVSCRLDAGTMHAVRLLTYLAGTPMARTAPTLGQAASLGRAVAALDRALADFSHPAAEHDLAWDLRHADRLRALVGHVGHAGCRAIAARVLDRFAADVLPRLGATRRQVVHNDVNPHNVLVDPADPDRVTGVLDFGDTVETHRICNVAVAAAYQVGAEDVIGQIAAFVGAYHAALALQPDEVALLPDLIMTRQVMTLVIGGWRASLQPENRAYILRNAPRAAAALERLDAIGRPLLEASLWTACAMA